MRVSANVASNCWPQSEMTFIFTASSNNSLLLSPAELPTSDVTTKRIKLAEEEEDKLKKVEEEKNAEEEVWPEPPKRVAPAVRTALVLPNDVACPDGCKRFSSSEDPVIVNKLRLHFS